MSEFKVGDWVYAHDWCYGQITDLTDDEATVEFETERDGGCFSFDITDLTKAPEPKSNVLNDGIYIELFAVKDGVRYNAKVLDMKEVTLILTNGLLNGIENLWEENKHVQHL